MYIETSNQNNGSIESASSWKHVSTFNPERKLFKWTFFFLFSVFCLLNSMRLSILLLQFLILIRDMKRKILADKSSVEGISNIVIEFSDSEWPWFGKFLLEYYLVSVQSPRTMFTFLKRTFLLRKEIDESHIAHVCNAAIYHSLNVFKHLL